MFGLFLEIVTIVLPVFIVVLLGYGVKRSNLVDDSFLFQLNRLVYFVALPLLLFYKIATADFEASFNGHLITGLIITIIFSFILSYVFAYVKGYPAHVRGTFSQCSFRGNVVYVGLAIVFSAYGDMGLASASVLLGFFVPVLNCCSIIALLLPQQGGKIKPLLLFQQIILNPLIVASLLGIIWSFLSLPIPYVVDKSLNLVTGMVLPLALISIGASFSIEKMRGDMTTAFLACAFKLVIMPVMAAILLYGLGVGGQDLAIGVLFAGTPTATAAYIFTQQMKGDAELSGSIIMLTTLFSILSLTGWLMILRSFEL